MADRVTLDMLGDKALIATLQSLPDKMERRVLSRATRAASQFVLTLARARTPRDSGRLAATMKLRALRRKKGRTGFAVQTGTRAELGIPASATGYYPAHIELGSVDTPANPYFRST